MLTAALSLDSLLVEKAAHQVLQGCKCWLMAVTSALVAALTPAQDERVRLSEQLAGVMAELRQATEANRQRQELNSQVCTVSWGKGQAYGLELCPVCWFAGC